MTEYSADRDALNNLLATNPDTVQIRAASAFDDRSGGRPVILCGAGGLGRRALAGMRAYGTEPIAFVDNSASRQGTMVDGIPILAPVDAARAYGRTAVFVVTIWGAGSPHRFSHSQEQLHALGCDCVLPFPLLFWKYPRTTLPYYLQDEPHHVVEQAAAVRAGFDLWEDAASRGEYLSQVRFRLLSDFDGLAHPVGHAQYFPADLYAWRDDESIIDGGAFDGDTIRSLIAEHGGRFQSVLACEPDPNNYVKLEAMIADLPPVLRAKISCRQIALASSRGVLHLDATGTAASATQPVSGPETITVMAESLDTLVNDMRPTMLKLDIEGAEHDALLGARRIIAESAPVLAICVYHRQDHLWTIPLLLRAYRDDYALFLRPHNEEGFDLICYAVPRHRLLA